MNIQLKMKKTHLIKGKFAKSPTTFRKNKANFKNIKIGVNSFKISKCENLPAWRSKKQTQFKPKANPIPERPKMNTNIYYTLGYNNKTFFLAPKTKPNKAKVANNQSSLSDNQLRRQTQFKADTNLWRILNVKKNSLKFIFQKCLTVGSGSVK